MKKRPSTSLLISTYNWHQALELVLLSIKKQTVLPNEVLIADDGSTDETKALIASFQKIFQIPIHHFWHEDHGFRKALILNKAIANINSEYIIQVDGDCILHKNFVQDHIAFAAKNTYLFGSRVTIKKNHLTDLFKNKEIKFNLFLKGIKKRTRTLHLPILSELYGKTNELPHKFRGCNVSFWKKDIIAVNGYNEDFKGWGREDSEIIVRLINTGVLGRRLRYRGIVYHIFHNEKPKDRLELNDDIQQNSINNNLRWCTNGIDKYLV
jgi:glycosyltransferase involved in cell wall biosynthesis